MPEEKPQFVCLSTNFGARQKEYLILNKRLYVKDFFTNFKTESILSLFFFLSSTVIHHCQESLECTVIKYKIF